MRATILAVGLALTVTSAFAETVRLGPDDLEKLAFVMLARGDAAAALDMADALVGRSPRDATALILKSRAERALGRTTDARASASRAWSSSRDDQERYGAALAMAQALATDGQRLRAQWWLRQAAQNAPNPTARAIAEQDFQYVRSRTRLQLRFDLSVQPSSNVNNGSSQSTLTIPGLPFVFDIDGAGQALSGWQGTIGASGRYGLGATDQTATDLTFAITSQSVILSEAAQRQAPGARGADFAYWAVEGGIAHQWMTSPRTQLNAAVILGASSYGGERLADYLRVSVEGHHSLSDRSRLTFGATAERQLRLDDAESSASIVGVTGGGDWILGNRDRLSIAVTARNTRSNAVSVDHTAYSVALNWQKAAPVLGAAIGASVSVEARDYPVSAYSTEGRHDVTLNLGATATLTQIDYLGFSPVVSISVSETASNINLYDTQDASIGFSIRSTF